MFTTRKSNGERGAMTIIEAAFVFPITFIIVFVMIMTGEAYYQRARVEHYVNAAAINGAAKCENPLLQSVIDGGSVPTDPGTTEILPYRYILTGEAKSVAAQVESELLERVEGAKPLLFKNMKPSNVAVSVTPHINPLVSSFPVKCEFEVPFPIRMIFTGKAIKFSYIVSTTAAVGDPAEFIRNVSIISDVAERNEQFMEFCGKVKEGLEKIGAYLG